MADEETKKFLESWGVQQSVVQCFEANGMTTNLIKDLTPELIKELIPDIGPRMVFMTKWKASFQADKRKCPEDDSDTGSLSSRDSISETDENLEPNTSEADRLTGKTFFAGKQMYKRLQRPDVHQILNNSEQGRKIVEGYRDLPLSKEARDDVLEIIISNFMNTVKGNLDKHDFYDIAKGIVKVFPKEHLEVYYLPPVSKKKSRTNKSISVRGKVAVAYHNRRQRTNRALQACRKNKENTSKEKDNEAKKSPSEETKQSISWLETNQEPWDMVKAHWGVTAELRLYDIRNSGSGKIDETIKKWPILRHPKGYCLIHQDFESMQLSTTEDAIKHWPAFFERIQKVCPYKHQRKVPRVQTLFNVLNDDLDDGTHCGAKAIVQLAMLPYLIPPKGRVRAKSGHWKPSMIESEESLVVHTATANDICRIREDRVKSMRQLGLTVQPYIIVVGPTLTNIDSYFVSMDSILYSVNSAFEAIDTCFKIFHVLHAEYPPASEHIWYLIQRELYQFITVHDKKAPYILEVITALCALKDSESEN